MKYYLPFTGFTPDADYAPFPASVPGNIQRDFLDANPGFLSDINYGMEHRKMRVLEPYTWVYAATLAFDKKPGEKLWFVTEGIDYIWDLALDGEIFYSHEGMFTRVELCLDDILGDKITSGAKFEVIIHPHPMLHDEPRDRTQAAQCCKPPVSYEWDWHPRVIPSGIWDETYFETRDSGHIDYAEARYKLSEDLKTAAVTFDVRCESAVTVSLYDPAGDKIASLPVENGKAEITLENVKLWWCRGLGEPNLYRWVAESASDRTEGTIGFRRTKLIMNKGAWNEPDGFPKSRSYPPAQIELNGIPVFAKGSNYVNQEIFPGIVTPEQYEETVQLAIDANMNIFRCWGGSGIQKKAFYDICDRYGMMLWVEFPLSCNNYYDSDHYLAILEQEGRAIIEKLRCHPSVVLWCGGNELFNNWSLMTDQHLALRLLNKLTYDLTPEIPYIMTSPLAGMKHGGYTFIDRTTGLDQFALFTQSRGTTYTEFGIPGITSVEEIRSMIPEDELFPPKPGGSWQDHHAFKAWGDDAWLCIDTLAKYGDISTLESMVETSQWLQGVGYKAIFEEARRQKPYCSMAINWCWCEPWKCAVNNSLIGYPNLKKSGWYTVRDSLRDVVGTVRMTKFAWARGEEFFCEPWLLNDTLNAVSAELSVSVTIVGRTYDLGTCTLNAGSNANAHGTKFSFAIPVNIPDKTHMEVECRYVIDGKTEFNRYSMLILD